MQTSYRIFAAVIFLAAAGAYADGSRFSAADVPAGLGIKKQGTHRDPQRRAVDHRVQFLRQRQQGFGASYGRATRCVTHRSAPRVYDSSAQLNTALPVYLASAIGDAAKQHGIDPRLLAAVARRESRFNPAAVSPVGACGVMQLMPATARYLGVKDIFNARENVFGGAKYLRALLDTFHGDLDLTLAAYNAGPGAVQKYNGVPPFRETRAYVSSIRTAYQRSLAIVERRPVWRAQ